jgi:hypothetical protein
VLAIWQSQTSNNVTRTTNPHQPRLRLKKNRSTGSNLTLKHAPARVGNSAFAKARPSTEYETQSTHCSGNDRSLAMQNGPRAVRMRARPLWLLMSTNAAPSPRESFLYRGSAGTAPGRAGRKKTGPIWQVGPPFGDLDLTVGSIQPVGRLGIPCHGDRMRLGRAESLVRVPFPSCPATLER